MFKVRTFLLFIRVVLTFFARKKAKDRNFISGNLLVLKYKRNGW